MTVAPTHPEPDSAEALCRRCGEALVVEREHESHDVPATMICDTCCEGYNALAEALAAEYINEDALAAGIEAERQAQVAAKAAAAGAAAEDEPETETETEPAPADDKRYSRGDIFGGIIRNARERADAVKNAQR